MSNRSPRVSATTVGLHFIKFSSLVAVTLAEGWISVTEFAMF